ncbi:UNVERIFIED_CONTAM: hypothetical protein HDU68_001120 [Siphonaria sp. JEL0065]|nr:hypothetical protein HDU68_001120 [Siphonaria sp. JEL0065]
MKSPIILSLILSYLASFASAATPADCQTVNQFLCQTQCGKVLIQCTGIGAGAVLPPLDEDAAVCNQGRIDFATNCLVNGQQPATPANPAPPVGGNGGAAQPAPAPGADQVALGTTCTSGQYACGPRDTAANQDTIAVCQGGVFIKSANCDEGAGVCQLINGVPYCL